MSFLKNLVGKKIGHQMYPSVPTRYFSLDPLIAGGEINAQYESATPNATWSKEIPQRDLLGSNLGNWDLPSVTMRRQPRRP